MQLDAADVKDDSATWDPPSLALERETLRYRSHDNPPSLIMLPGPSACCIP